MFRFLTNTMDRKRCVVLGMLLCWCATLVLIRVERTGSGYFLFLLWNLFLAGMPLMFSSALRFLVNRRWPLFLQFCCFGMWLLFLPNAPYILTDLQHLAHASSVPTWYDVALLVSCAGTGVLFGYLSLEDVQEIISRRLGTIFGWLVAVASLVLTGFAIYLGRFLRWNSWDVILNPQLVIDLGNGLLHPTGHTQPLAVTFIFGTILALGYIALRVLLAQPNASPPRVDLN